MLPWRCLDDVTNLAIYQFIIKSKQEVLHPHLKKTIAIFCKVIGMHVFTNWLMIDYWVADIKKLEIVMILWLNDVVLIWS